MRSQFNEKVERCRIRDGFRGTQPGEKRGAFVGLRPRASDPELTVIISSGCGWEHVSASRPVNPPTWDQMAGIKDLFFDDTETVVQFHVPRTDHVNYHPNCLHLWRPTHSELPRPPAWMVGPTRPGMTQDEAEQEARAWCEANGFDFETEIDS